MTGIDLESDAAALAASASQIAGIGEIAEHLKLLESELAELTERAKAKAEEIRVVLEDELPDAMDAAGCEEFRTSDGRTIKVAKVVRAAISKDRESAAFDWLRENGFDDLIKNKVEVSLGREQDALTAKLRKQIEKLGLEPTVKESVNPQTLSAFCREKLEEGMKLPAELLGIYAARVAKITTKKGKTANGK